MLLTAIAGQRPVHNVLMLAPPCPPKADDDEDTQPVPVPIPAAADHRATVDAFKAAVSDMATWELEQVWVFIGSEMRKRRAAAAGQRGTTTAVSVARNLNRAAADVRYNEQLRRKRMTDELERKLDQTVAATIA